MVSCVQSSGPLRPWRCFWKWDYQGQDLWSQEYKKYVLHYCHAECGRINGGMSFLWIFKHTQIAISESVMEQMMISVIILLTMLNVGEMRSCVFLHAVCMHLHFVEVDASCVYIYISTCTLHTVGGEYVSSITWAFYWNWRKGRCEEPLNLPVYTVL